WPPPGGSLPSRAPDRYNQSFPPVGASRPILGGRPTVGHLPLEQVIGVRIPASQPISLAHARSLGWSARVQALAGSLGSPSRARIPPIAATRCQNSTSH